MTQVYREWAKKRETNRQKLNSKRMNTRQKSDWNNEEEAVIAFKANWIRWEHWTNIWPRISYAYRTSIQLHRRANMSYELSQIVRRIRCPSLSQSFFNLSRQKIFFSFHSAPFEAKWLFLTFFLGMMNTENLSFLDKNHIKTAHQTWLYANVLKI